MREMPAAGLQSSLYHSGLVRSVDSQNDLQRLVSLLRCPTDCRPDSCTAELRRVQDWASPGLASLHFRDWEGVPGRGERSALQRRYNHVALLSLCDRLPPLGRGTVAKRVEKRRRCVQSRGAQ